MEHRTVLITGGGRGIGAAAVRTFAQAGYRVALHYHHSEERALTLARELSSEGHTVFPVKADLADSRQVREMTDRVLNHFRQLDTLVCNAGVSWNGLLCDMTDEEWARLRGVDLDGVLFCCREVYRHMVGRKSGRILTVSSMWGRSGASCEAAYSAAKAGVIGLTKALAQELGPSGITVNCVAPGVIDTEMNAHLSAQDLRYLAEETPLCRLGTPEEVARALLFLASPEADFITGQVLGVDGGFLL